MGAPCIRPQELPYLPLEVRLNPDLAPAWRGGGGAEKKASKNIFAASPLSLRPPTGGAFCFHLQTTKLCPFMLQVPVLLRWHFSRGVGEENCFIFPLCAVLGVPNLPCPERGCKEEANIILLAFCGPLANSFGIPLLDCA